MVGVRTFTGTGHSHTYHSFANHNTLIFPHTSTNTFQMAMEYPMDRMCTVQVDVLKQRSEGGSVYMSDVDQVCRFPYALLNEFLRLMEQKGEWAVFLNGKCVQMGQLTTAQVTEIEKSWL